MWATDTAPTGWVLCDGTSYLRSDLAALFAVIGTTYGAADGTHFNVPDCRGRAPVGYAAGAGNADVNALGGNEGVALASRRPRHDHTFTQPTITKPTVNVVQPTISAPAIAVVQPTISAPAVTVVQPTISAPAVTITDLGHTHTIQAQGGTTLSTTGTQLATASATGGTSRAMAAPTTANTHTTGVTAALAAAPVATGGTAALASAPVATGGTAALASAPVASGGSASLGSTPTASGGAAGVGGTAPVDTPAYLVVGFIIKT